MLYVSMCMSFSCVVLSRHVGSLPRGVIVMWGHCHVGSLLCGVIVTWVLFDCHVGSYVSMWGHCHCGVIVTWGHCHVGSL